MTGLVPARATRAITARILLSEGSAAPQHARLRTVVEASRVGRDVLPA